MATIVRIDRQMKSCDDGGSSILLLALCTVIALTLSTLLTSVNYAARSLGANQAHAKVLWLARGTALSALRALANGRTVGSPAPGPPGAVLTQSESVNGSTVAITITARCMGSTERIQFTYDTSLHKIVQWSEGS